MEIKNSIFKGEFKTFKDAVILFVNLKEKFFLKTLTLLLSILFLLTGCNNHNKVAINEPVKIRNSKTIDSLKTVFEKLKEKKYDTIVRERINDLSIQFYSNNDTISYYKCLKIVEKNSSIIKDTFGLIRVKTNLAMFHLYRSSSDSSYYYLTKAEKLSINTKENPFLGAILQSKANLQWLRKDYSGAEVTAIKALKIAKEKRYPEAIFSAYTTIANSLTGMDKEDKALFYYNKALLISNQISNVNYRIVFNAQTYNYIAKVYQKTEHHSTAIHFLERGLENKKIKTLDIDIYNYLQNNLGYSHFKLGHYKEALQLFEKVLTSADNLKFVPTQIAVRTNLVEYYLKQKDLSKAKRFCIQARKMAHDNSLFEDELKTLKLLAQIDSKNNAIYQRQFIQLNDSLQSIERTTRDKFARIEFETDEISKEKEIVEDENDKLITQIWLITSLALLSLFVVVLWFMNKSQKAKTRELLLKQEQQKAKEEIYQLILNQQQKIEEGKQIEKRRISQELHDGIMGRLSSIRMNLFILNKKTDEKTIKKCLEYINEIQSIEKEIRTIAHDLNKNLFSDSANFYSIVENLFTSIKNHNDIEFVLITDERIDWETVNNNTKMNVFRIIQESLQNIDKYAKAKKVSITMTKKDETINIEIKDDGIGFDLNSHKKGIGITNMQKRMEDCQGQFKIVSNGNSGTKINLIIPN